MPLRCCPDEDHEIMKAPKSFEFPPELLQALKVRYFTNKVSLRFKGFSLLSKQKSLCSKVNNMP